MARRGDDVDPEPRQVVVRVGHRGELVLARVARARVDVPDRERARAIGAADLVDHLDGRIPLSAARDRAVIATRQYAKSQRIWFRGRMRDWVPVAAAH